MSEPNTDQNPGNTAEPLLPIEKTLIRWSLGVGIGALVILLVVNHFMPINV